MKSLFVSTLALAAATAAGAQTIVQVDNDWYAAGQARVQAEIAKLVNQSQAKNVILMVSDGNGVGTNYATRIFDGQQKGMLGEENVLPFEAFPNLALVKTYNINAQTPDSAPTAGAMNTGVKQRFNLINLGGDAVHDDCSTVSGNELTLMSEIVTDMGKSVGIVSTARLTHATPAAVYSKTANRNWEDSVPEGCTAQFDIATQLIAAIEAGTIDFAMGGGARHFIPDGAEVAGFSGRRADGVNLIERAEAAGAAFAFDTDSFNALDLSSEDPILALYEASHMQYEADRSDEPSLAEMTAAAIEYLSKDADGFYLEVEAGRVDHASHAGNAYRTFTDGVAFAEAVAIADEMTDDADTLIIVTADHEHAIAFNGYCGRGSPITGLCYGVSQVGDKHSDEPLTAADGKPYTVVGFLNGSGSVLVEQKDGTYSGERPDVANEDAMDIDYVQQALIPMGSETHSGEDVALYAKGPWAHLFDGTIEQNVIFHVMLHALTAE